MASFEMEINTNFIPKYTNIKEIRLEITILLMKLVYLAIFPFKQLLNLMKNK
jgi:hypothetical protein